MKLSVVVPTLDEATTITATLSVLAPLRAAGHEVIVADGGSGDGTRELARPLADRIVLAARGRARQMNAGASLARGDVLLFLHADTRLPANAADAIAAALATGARWGRFDVVLDGHSALLPVVAALMNARSRATGIATGDQALFVTRAAFDAAGRFPPLPLMEDVALSRMLKRVAGPPACLRERVVSAGRRWDAHGAIATILLMWRLRFDYWRGVDATALARRYTPSRPPPVPVLQVFVRAPREGEVKTRLAASVGTRAALDAYVALVEATLATARAARERGIVDTVELWAATAGPDAMLDRWCARDGLVRRDQPDGDLGARMQAAIGDALARGQPALLVGTDCPGLTADDLAEAAAALAREGAVFGPAEDGGYVLVGLASDADVFRDMPWSTPALMASTRARLAGLGLPWHELPPRWDVDTVADLQRWRGGVSTGPQGIDTPSVRMTPAAPNTTSSEHTGPMKQ